MAEFAITFARSARKELEALSTSTLNRVFPKIERLATEPRPPGARKPQGEDDIGRIRVGDYRVIYAVDDTLHIVDIVAVRHRSAAYR